MVFSSPKNIRAVAVKTNHEITKENSSNSINTRLYVLIGSDRKVLSGDENKFGSCQMSVGIRKENFLPILKFPLNDVEIDKRKETSLS